MTQRIITTDIDRIDGYFKWQEKGRQHNLLIDATAGSGKTTTLVAGHLAATHRGNRVLALAFSGTGVSKYNELLKLEAPSLGLAFAGDQLCQTFEQFTFSCLAQYGTKIRAERGHLGDAVKNGDFALDTMRMVVDSLNERYEYQQREEGDLLSTSESELVGYLELVSNLKINLLFKERFAYLDDEEMTDEVQEDIDEFIRENGLPHFAYSMLNAYENLRDGRQFLRYGDAAYELIKDPKAIHAYLKARNISLVLVDEFHDTKPAYFELLKIFQRAGCSIVVVGDEAQDIFAWKDLTYFSACDAFRLLEPVTTMPLTRTFRFGRPASSLISKQLAKVNKQKVEITPAGHKTHVVQFDGSDEASLLKVIRQAMETALETNDREKMVVIYPHHQMANSLMRSLCESGIPYHTGRIHPLHGSLEVQLNHAVSLLYDWSQREFGVLDAMALSTFLELPVLKLDFDTQRELKQQIVVYKQDTSRVESYQTHQIPDLIATIRTMLNFEPLACDQGALERIWKKLGFVAWMGAKAPNKDVFNASWSCLQKESARFVQMGAQAYIDELYKDFDFFSQNKWKPGVEITSVLQCKGREWASVILPNEWAPYFDSSNKLHQKQLYVAMSRVKENLFLPTRYENNK